MKRILLFAIFCTTSVFAQDLYDQTAGGNGDGMICSQFTDKGDTTIFAADDFDVPIGDNWQVTDITIRGYRNGTGADMTSMKVRVIANQNGVPASTPIYSTIHTIDPIPAPVGDTAINIVLNNTLVLTTGKYWLIISGASPSTGGWHWSGVDGTYGLEAVADDSANYLGSITNGWTVLSGYGKTFTDLSFKIGGTGNSSSVEDETLTNISLYPNPVTDVMTIANIDASEIKSISVYGISGQLQMQLPIGNQIYLSNLAAGSYLLEVKTLSGVIRRRFNKI